MADNPIVGFTKDELTEMVRQILTEIPSSLPANGGNADYATNAGNANTIAGKPIDNIFHSATINAVNDIDNTDGNWSTDFVTAWSPIAGTFPDGVYNKWFSVRQYQTSATKDFKIQFLQTIESLPRMWHRCKQHEGIWPNWQEIYTSVNKPYIVGNATVTANSSVCASEHGFMPSAVLWWDNTTMFLAAAKSFDSTAFSINPSSNVDRTINYIIFK